MTQGDDNTWTQTLISVTPEDDAVLREIADTALLSADASTQLELNAENIIHRRPLNYKHIVDPRELEDEPTRDAQNQTYLQGVTFVNIPIQYKDEAVQTMYMSTPCAPFRHFKEIMTSLNDSPMPIWKKNNFAQTILTYVVDTEQQVVIDGLMASIEEEDHEKSPFAVNEKEAAEISADEILNFILDRAFWISDPSSRLHASLVNEEAQTSIRYNYSTNKVVLDGETQTGLTCEPKQSNTKLLSDYQEIKEFARDCIENCVHMAIDCRVVVDEIIDELIDKSAERIRYPMKAQQTQTVASYRLNGEKEEEVLRKLKRDVIVDPFESSIVVIPLIDDILLNVCEKVSINAQSAVKNIIKMILQRVAVIIVKLLEIRKESRPKPMDDIFDQRRKKIVESMAEKETETISTQTRIAGVPEVTKIKEPREVVCCTACRRHSTCHWCLAAQEGGDVPEQEHKILRTQDILLAYKPCYVVATSSEQMKNAELERTFIPEKIKAPPLQPLHISEESIRASSETVSVLLKPRGRVKERDSASGWSFIIDTALTEPWSTHGFFSLMPNFLYRRVE
ncbi:hypothetical protein KM043_002202 [Ampulex compressa]|nr:hypothetical protein KM043_002202 [Ampulex compressa]